MIDKQEAEGPIAPEPGRGRAAPFAALALAAALVGCTAVRDMTQSPEEAAAQQPQRVSTEGAKDEFPNLSAVPDEPRTRIAPEDRERMINEMIEDRGQATFSGAAGEPAPLVTEAPPDPFSTSVIISGDSSQKRSPSARLKSGVTP